MRRILPIIFLFSATHLLQAQELFYSLVPNLNSATESNLSISVAGLESLATDVAYSNDGLSMFVLGTANDSIYDYALTSAFDFTTASYSGDAVYVGAQETNPQGMTFNEDGTKIFVVGASSGSVHMYNLTTAFDLSTASYSGESQTISTVVASPVGIDFNPEGTKMYIVSASSITIFEYDLSTSFSVTTAVYNSASFSVSDNCDAPSDLEFTPNGKHVYVMDQSGNRVVAYELSTAYDITSATLFDQLELNNAASNAGLAFSKDFTEVLTVTTASSLTGFSLDNIAFQESIENDGTLVGSLIVTIVGDTLVNAGSVLEETTHYAIDNLAGGFTPVMSVDASGLTATLTLADRTISDQDTLDISSLQFTFTDDAFVTNTAAAVTNATGPAESGLGIDLDAGFVQPAVSYSLVPDVSEASSTGTTITPTEDSGYLDLTFSGDGTKLFVLGVTDSVYQYSLSRAFDASTASSDGVSLYLGGEDTSPVALQFDNSGGRLFILGATNDAIFRYNLTSSFDLSTASYSGSSFTVSTFDSAPAGFAFNGDGTSLYLVGNTGKTIDEFILSDPFNLNAIAFSTTLSLSTSNTYNAIQFASNGETFFLGTTTSIIGYDVTSAFSISGATQSSAISLSTSGGTSNAFRFTSSFTQLWQLNSASTISEYEIPAIAFEETDDNDGQLDGLLVARIARGTFSSDLSADDVTVAGIPSGYTSSVTLGDDLRNISIQLSGQTESNDQSNSVSDIQISFSDNAFDDLTASEVNNATDAQTGLGISYTAGSNIPTPGITYAKVPNISNISDTVTQTLSVADLEGFVFNNDGSKLYALNLSTISEYFLSTNYDITTASLTYQLSISSQETAAHGLAFNDVGSRLFIVGSTGNISLFRLTLGFDLTTATFDSVVATISDDSSVTDIAFNDDGTRMYILGDTNNTLFEYELSEPFDPSTNFLIDDLSFGSTVTSPQGISFSLDGSTFFVVDAGLTRLFQYDLSTSYSVSTAEAKLINVSITTDISTPTAVQLAGDGKSLMISGTVTDQIHQYSFPPAGFVESSANDGALEGRIIARLIGDTFTGAGETYTNGGRINISDVPFGIDPSINISSNGLVLTIDYDGNALNNDTEDIVEDILIRYTDLTFTNSTAAEVSTSTGSDSTKLGIAYEAGSTLVLDVELSQNNEVIPDLVLDGNSATVFSWLARAGTEETVIDTVTINASYNFGGILTDFALASGTLADGSDRTALSPDNIAITDSLVSFQKIADTLDLIEERYYFITATATGVSPLTDTINFNLVSTNLLVTGPAVTETTVLGSEIAFTDLGFIAVQDGIVDSIAYGETKIMDVNNDDQLDVVAAGIGTDGSSVLKYFTNANGTLSAGISFGTAKDSVRLAPGDFDNDVASQIDLFMQGYATNDNGATLYNNDDLNNGQEFDELGGNLVNGDIAAGDLDGDGDLDILLTGHEDTDNTSFKIVIFSNDGDETYTLIDTLDITPVIDGDIELADVDNDGDLDAFVTGLDASGNPVAELHIKNANGFSLSSSAFTAVSQSAADFGDYDGDGYLDLIVSGIDESGPTISSVVYTNDGSGGFTASSIAVDDSYAGDVKWIDLDNDGDADLILTGITATDTTASVWINESAVLTEAYDGDIVGLAHGNITYGDLDGDDDPDLILNGVDGADNIVTQVYENSLFSGFVEEVSAPEGLDLTIDGNTFTLAWDSVAGFQYEVIVVQVDSLQDLNVLRSADSRRLNGFVRNPEKPRLKNTTYVINDVERAAYRIGVQKISSTGKGSEFTRIDEFFFGTPFAPIAISASDLTSNSFQANWVAQAAIDSFTVTLQREEVVEGSVTFVDEGTFGANTNSLEFKNLRRNRNYRYTVKAIDGELTSVASNEVRVILPLSSLFVSTNVNGLNDLEYDDLELADVDNDDKLDIIAISSAGAFVLLSDGSSTTVDLQAARGDAELTVFDFENDGDMDIFVTGTSSGAGVTSILVNDGSAGFTELVTNTTQFLQAKVASGDMDNDGDIDLVFMGLSSTDVRTEILINNGTNFDLVSTSFVAETQGDLALSDFDLDGDLDLVIIGSSSASWYENINGSFTNETVLDIDLLSEVDLKVEDMTGNGRPDLVYTGTADGSSFLKIYSVNANLNFNKLTDLNITSLSSAAPGLELIDADNDGTLDVFLIGTESMEVYSNITEGVLTDTEAIIIDLDGLANAASAFGDFDKDGDVDMLVSGLDGTSTADATLLNNANDTGNEVPSAPAGLEVSFASGNWQLQWDPATDDQTSKKELTYNVLIESTTDVLTSQSANAETGFRKISQYGQIQDTTWIFNPQDLPVGDYSWKVQAIDASNLGSLFSEPNPLTIPDTLKVFNNVNAITNGPVLGGSADVVFFSFGMNASTASTLDSMVFTMTADYRDYLAQSSFKLFQSVDATADLEPEDEVLNVVTNVDGNNFSISGLDVALSQQQVYFFLVADAKFVAAEGNFRVALNSENVFVEEADIVAEPDILVGRNISVESAFTTYTPIDVAETNFEADADNVVILSFSLNTTAPGVRLRGLAPDASANIADRFENIRIFSSDDNVFGGTDTELAVLTVNNRSMTADFNFVMSEANTDNFFFVVGDVVASVSQSTAPITFTMDNENLTLSSTNQNTVTYTTADYTFYFDLIPPVIQYGSFTENVQQGSGPHGVSFTVQDQSDITAVSFFWRQLSASAFQEQVLTVSSGNSYSFDFSAANIGNVGVEFYASATDADGNTNDPNVQSIGIFFDSTNPINLQSEANIKLDGESVTDYSLLSFPFQAGRFSDVLSGLENAKHGGLAELFGSDDNTKWRLISLDKGASSAAGFNDLGLGDRYNPGEGYYLIVGVKDVDIQVVAGESVDASSDDPHAVNLRSGWNMIGNPYLFSISIESIRDYNLAVGNISDASAINDIRLFKNGQFVANPSSMERFDGAFIRVTENISNFEFPMNDEIPAGGGGRIDLTRWDEHIEEGSWRLNLTLKQGGQLSLGGIGLKEDASDQVDIYDQYVLPAPGDYIRMQHEINDELSVIRNSIQAPGQTNVWKTSVHATKDGALTIEWDQEALGALSQSLYLFDPSTLRFVDMKATGAASISVNKGANDVLFYYGPEDLKEAELATDITAVGSVYPNPVVDQLKLNVLGPQGSAASVRLYDLFGKEVVNEEGTLGQTGINELAITLTSKPGAGLYFLEVQIRTEDRVILNKQKVLIND